MFQQILQILSSSLSIKDKYIQLYDCLDRLCIQLTQPLVANYNTLYTRLQALCRIYGLPMTNIEQFRYNARQIKKGKQKPIANQLPFHAKALVEAVEKFTNAEPPKELLAMLPDKIQIPMRKRVEFAKKKRLRCVVVDKDSNYLYAVSEEIPNQSKLIINYRVNDHTTQTAELINEGTQINVVSFLVDKDNVIHPELIIFEPDFLLDISRLTACVKPYGSSPFNALVDKFDQRGMTMPMLLGNVANQFLDDCIYNPEVDFNDSIAKAFHNNLVAFTVNDEINRDFFEETKRQFNNIKNTVDHLRNNGQLASASQKDEVLLEPSFFCETLGIQGRFDLLSADHKFLIELKSGKMDEYRNQPKTEHALQMLLYKEVIFYNLGIRQDHVVGHIFYSKYPNLLEIRSFKGLIQQVMLTRNRIVALERMLVDGQAREFLPKLTADRLWQDKQCGMHLWQHWCKPQLEEILNPIHEMDNLTADYFYTFLQFIEREHMMDKVGDNRLQSTRAMAALWNADLQTKLENGDIMIDLTLKQLRYNHYQAVEAVELQIINQSEETPNFRLNDAVILYQRDHETDNATNRQIVRGAVEAIEGNTIWIILRYPQKNKLIFASSHRFCIEHDHLESSFTSLYRGLFSLLKAPESRRLLLLCQRTPISDLDESTKHTPPQNIDQIIDAADKAKDYFLLVGPPGTGKTSVALRRMVEHFHDNHHTLLLMAYTNRAVDEICAMMEQTGIEYIRLGKFLAADPLYHHRLFENRVKECNSRQQVKDVVNKVNVIVSTVTSMFSNIELLFLKSIDVAIIDEASQILEPQLLGLLCAQLKGRCLIDKFIMIGDHKQLPAVVVQPAEASAVKSERLNAIGLTNCRNSLFERLHKNVVDDFRFVAQLNHQGRMHQDIADFVSKHFYNENLLPVPLPHQVQSELFIHVPDNFMCLNNRIAFFDVPQMTFEKREHKANQLEAEVIAQMVLNLMNLYHVNQIDFIPQQHLGIIVPFRRQITLIAKQLSLKGLQNVENILIDTVERLQGSQKDVIIYGTTISNDYEINLLSEVVDVAGTPIDRKLNVAITRARKQLFIVGCKNILQLSQPYRQLIESIPYYNLTDCLSV